MLSSVSNNLLAADFGSSLASWVVAVVFGVSKKRQMSVLNIPAACPLKILTLTRILLALLLLVGAVYIGVVLSGLF